jgi:hypothetical protein
MKTPQIEAMAGMTPLGIKPAKIDLRPEYFINLDERGDFYADVRVNEKTVFEIHGFDIFEDGFMKRKTDLAGLEQHLKSMGIINDDATLIRGN